MAAKKKSRADSHFDDDEDDDRPDNEVPEWSDDNENDKPRSVAPPGVRLRDWRDVERFREDRALRRALEEDDLLFDDE